MEPEEIDRAISQVGADDEPEEAKERFRELRRNPPQEGNAGETTIADLNPEQLGWLYYQFDFGDNWNISSQLKAHVRAHLMATLKSSRHTARFHHSTTIPLSDGAPPVLRADDFPAAAKIESHLPHAHHTGRMVTAGDLGDSHDLSRGARDYANEVIFGDEWPLTPDHVNLSRVTFETSTRMTQQHGVCSSDGRDNCTIRLSKQTHNRAGFEALKETIRHELVHAYQHQTTGVDTGHGESFKRWVEPLDLSGRCSTHYEKQPEDYKYRFYCVDGCGFIGGRHRWSVAVARAIEGTQVCGTCDAELRVEGPDGVLDEVPEWRDDTSFDEDDLRYRFYCENCGLIGGRRQMCKTVRRVVHGATICERCGSLDIETRDESGRVITPDNL